MSARVGETEGSQLLEHGVALALLSWHQHPPLSGDIGLVSRYTRRRNQYPIPRTVGPKGRGAAKSVSLPVKTYASPSSLTCSCCSPLVSSCSGQTNNTLIQPENDFNQRDVTPIRRAVSSWYSRSRPRFSTRTSPAASRMRRCRVVVGQLHANRFAISPAVISPPRKRRTRRMCRRDACANALNTASTSASCCSALDRVECFDFTPCFEGARGARNSGNPSLHRSRPSAPRRP